MPTKIKYPLYKPFLGAKEKEYVNDCLDTTWISSNGKYVDLFEKRFAKYIGINYAVAVNNGTAALHTALLALRVGRGDEVIVPTLTYISSVNSIAYTGATPIFVDSESETWQVDVDDIESKITKKTKAIMLVHLYGHPCEMDKIMKIAKKHNLYVIEDCAEALGSEYRGRKVGTFGDIACFSFFGNKTITTGEGGMVITNNKGLEEKVRHLKTQGVIKKGEYNFDTIGYNYRMTNICAAIGYAQLEKVNEIVSKKEQIAKWYKTELKNLPVSFHKSANNVRHTYWMCSILTNDSLDREQLRKYLKVYGVDTRPLFYPIHLTDMYKGKCGDFLIAENLSLRGINLPSYPELTKDDVHEIINVVRKYYE